MSTGRSQPSIVVDVQVLVTHADSVATMEQWMGSPPRLIRAPDACYLFRTCDQERLPGFVDRWEPYGIVAQVVLTPPLWGRSTRYSRPTPQSCQVRAGRDPSTLASRLIRKTSLCMAAPAIGETRLRSTTEHVHEGHDQTAETLNHATEQVAGTITDAAG